MRDVPGSFWLALGGAIAMRLPGLAHGLRGDEGAVLTYAALPLDRLIPAIVENDAHPPLSYLFFHVWGLAGGGDMWMRALSAAAGVATCVLVYLIGEGVFDRRIRLTAMWIAALAPLSVLMSLTIRSYVFAGLFVLLAVWCWLRMAQAGRVGMAYAGGYVVAAAAALYSFYLSALPLAMLSAAALAAWWGRWPLVGRWTALQLAVAAAYLPWLPLMQAQLGRVDGQTAWLPGLIVSQIHVGGMARAAAGAAGVDDALLISVPLSAVVPLPVLLLVAAVMCAGAAALAVWGARAVMRQTADPAAARAMMAIAIGSVLLTLAAHVAVGIPLSARYSYLGFLFVAYLAAALLWSLRPGARRAAMALVFAVLAGRSIQLHTWREVDWKGAGRYLASAAGSDDAAVYRFDMRGERYLPPRVRRIELMTGATAEIDGAAVNGRRVWAFLVNSFLMSDSNRAIEHWLAGHGFSAVDRQDFGDLQLVRYER